MAMSLRLQAEQAVCVFVDRKIVDCMHKGNVLVNNIVHFMNVFYIIIANEL